jgi:hypothetical protein
MRTLVIVCVAAFATGAAAGAASAAKTPPKTSQDAYRACLAKHGVTFGGPGKRPSQAQIQTAFRACRSLAPAGGGRGGFPQPTAAQRQAFQKYAACLSKHGVKLAARPFRRRAGTPPPNRTFRRRPVSAKFKAAQKACASLRPAFPGRPPRGSGGASA